MKMGCYKRQLFVFTAPGQVANLCLPDGFRFVFFVSGKHPEAAPIDRPGYWEIDIPELLAEGRYPVAVTTVDLAHVAAFEAMPVSAVNAMLKAIAMEEARHTPPEGTTQ